MSFLHSIRRVLGYGAGGRIRKLAAALLVVCAQSATAEQVTIAALGDSLTQGFGLPPEEGFVPQLQDWLTGEGADVVLVNAGVSGDTTAGGLARIGWTLTPEVDGLIVALGGNDLLRGIAPEVARANIEGILQAAEAAGVPVLLAGMQAPGNFGPGYKQAFDAIYPELAEAYGAILFPSFLGALGDPAADGIDAVKPYLQADLLHPNAEGVGLMVAAIGPSVLALIDQVE